MKVIIKKSGSAHYWYADKIGHVFEVIGKVKHQTNGEFKYIVDDGYKYIHEDDAVKFSILDFIRINWPYFIGKKKQITRKF
jgi:hypothetical protein